MTRVAAIDCGTNSLRLLVTDIDPLTGSQHDLERRMEIVRLGQGVDRTGRFDDDALRRTFSTLRAYHDLIGHHGAERVRMVATSATRDVANSDVFVDGVMSIVGTSPDVVSGDDEAALSFTGATRGLRYVPPTSPFPPHVPSPYLVADIGGGSTELALGSASLTAARSVDVGCVRLTERWFADDPPTTGQVAAAQADIERALDEASGAVPIEEAASLIGVAGSATTVGALHLGLTEYDASLIHHTRVPAPAVRAISDRLLAAGHDERAAMRVIHPGRVDVIAAGALVLRCIVDRLAVDDVVVSEHDILDGVAWSIASP